MHKTLPAFTQTALLHVCSERVSLEQVKKFLSIYQTSSPSYILMAGIDVCMEFLEKEGEIYFKHFEKQLEAFYQKVSDLKCLKVMRKCDFSKEEIFDFDESKILIFVRKQGKNRQISGADLQKQLLEMYGLQMEMACGTYTLALSSIMDTQKGFERLAKALLETDHLLQKEFISVETVENTDCEFFDIYKVQKKNMEIFEAQEMYIKYVDWKDAVGKTAGDYVYLYPPGIPMIVPGEEITKTLIEDVQLCQKRGLEVEGLLKERKIAIVE